MRLLPGGGAVAPFFAPPPAPRPSPARLERLRALLAAAERRHGLGHTPRGIGLPATFDPRLVPGESASASLRETVAPHEGWTLGAPELDSWLPGQSLDGRSLIEIKPESPKDLPAALNFALLLAVRRLRTKPAHEKSRGLLSWCWPFHVARESGGLYGPGLRDLGLDPARVLIIEAPKPSDALWAMEESIVSGAAALVVGCLEGIELTPARRLALASGTGRTPTVLVTAAHTQAAPATSTRWRIAAAPSAPHGFDPAAPGDPRFKLMLERCRGTALGTMMPSCLVEWSHDTHCFRVVAGMADRTSPASSRTRENHVAGTLGPHSPWRARVGDHRPQ